MIETDTGTSCFRDRNANISTQLECVMSNSLHSRLTRLLCGAEQCMLTLIESILEFNSNILHHNFNSPQFWCFYLALH